MKKNYYINFLNLLKAFESTTDEALQDSTCKQILEEIAIGVSNDKLLTVSDVMSFKQLGSPATLHRKLDVLLNAKLVESIFQGNNRRTKYINLTPSGQAYFERLSSAIESVQSIHQ